MRSSCCYKLLYFNKILEAVLFKMTTSLQPTCTGMESDGPETMEPANLLCPHYLTF